MHAMGQQSYQNCQGSGGGTSFFWVLFSPNPHILSGRQTKKLWDLNVYDTCTPIYGKQLSLDFSVGQPLKQLIHIALVQNLRRNCPDFLHISGTKFM
jgi:hypothetical protein